MSGSRRRELKKENKKYISTTRKGGKNLTTTSAIRSTGPTEVVGRCWQDETTCSHKNKRRSSNDVVSIAATASESMIKLRM